ncbi:MAG: YihY/virulence factor BrkB family protein [Hydrogenophaga sp.]|nr:YihY/virulence factor BrkB family protein [Hydrogenophaga sp.]
MLMDAVTSFFRHDSPAAGAALAFYTLFSLAPMLMVAIAVAGLVFGAEAARGELFIQIEGLIGTQGALAVQGLLANVQQNEQGGWGALVGVGLLLFGATTVFAQLRTALDTLWHDTDWFREAPVKVPWWSLLQARLTAFGTILAIGFLLLVSLAVDAALTALQPIWQEHLIGWPTVMRVLALVISTLLSAALFAVLLRFLPSVRVAWRHVWIGAAVTSALFALSRWAIGWYIGTTAVNSGYGAASSLVAVLVWVYVSAQIFLFGAEVTRAVAVHEHREQRAQSPVRG